MTPVCIAPTGDRCGEGVVWSADEAAVYWTDINRFLIHRLDTASDAVHSWMFEEPVVALALTTRRGTMLVALGSRLLLWQPESNGRHEHGFALPGWPRVRLNDGRPDPLGNFWVGSMRNNVLPDGEPGEAGPGEGKLFRIAPDGAVTVWREDLGISNTLCWSPDHRRFYFGDTLENEVCAYDYDRVSGAIANERPFLRATGAGFPDGSAIDAEGWLWNCRWGGGCLLRAAPDGSGRADCHACHQRHHGGVRRSGSKDALCFDRSSHRRAAVRQPVSVGRGRARTAGASVQGLTTRRTDRD